MLRSNWRFSCRSWVRGAKQPMLSLPATTRHALITGPVRDIAIYTPSVAGSSAMQAFRIPRRSGVEQQPHRSTRGRSKTRHRGHKHGTKAGAEMHRLNAECSWGVACVQLRESEAGKPPGRFRLTSVPAALEQGAAGPQRLEEPGAPEVAAAIRPVDADDEVRPADIADLLRRVAVPPGAAAPWPAARGLGDPAVTQPEGCLCRTNEASRACPP